MTAQPSGVSATPHTFGSSANLLRVHSAPPSRSLPKMSNSHLLSTDAWGTPLVTGLLLDFVPLTTSSRPSQSASFRSTSVCLPHPYFNSVSMRLLRETRSQTFLTCSPPHLPSQSFHHRRLSGQSTMTSQLRIHADYSPPLSCPKDCL